MVTKNFSQMTTKKLNALLETANEQDRVKIQKVLNAREQVKAQAEETEDEVPLTPEEQAMLDAAELNGGINPMYTPKDKSPKMSNDECEALAAELKEKNMHHKCQVVPFNTIEWADGYIAGVLHEKRSNKVMYQIKLDDGRKLVKVHDSKMLRIFDEIVTIERAPRKVKEPRAEWAPEIIEKLSNEAMAEVGKLVSIKVDRSEEAVEGRIVSFVAEKRSQAILFRVEIAAPTEENANAVKTVHKVMGSSGLVIAEDFDEVGQALHDKFIARRTNTVKRETLSPQERVLKCEANLAKAQEALAKAQEALKAKEAQLEQAKSELEAFLAAQEDLI